MATTRQVYEGSWEDVVQRAGELSGKRVRLEILMHGSGEFAAEAPPFYVSATPAERARAYRDWAESHTRDSPVLSDAAISRENIYSDDRD